MIKSCLKQTSGFTLIELVITIVIAGIIMVMIGPYFQSGIITKPGTLTMAQRVQYAMDLQRVMENINGAYGTSSKDQAALVTLQTAIGAVGSSPTNTYGSYKVLENGYITFNAVTGAEVTSGTPTPVLKVTISSTNPSTSGYQLTQLFTVQVAH